MRGEKFHHPQSTWCTGRTIAATGVATWNIKAAAADFLFGKSCHMTQEEDPVPVKVYVYDLSHGLAAVYAPVILGIPLDGIYHTSTVVHGKEYYIDQGIKEAIPGTTKYGTPREVIDMGETYVTKDILEDFLQELRVREDKKYHASKYDLFDNNCNHFTDTVLEFLTGSHLEDRILGLPQRVLASPNGMLLRQMIGGGAIA